MFEIRDASGDGDGWIGVEAETLEGARLACETIHAEGGYVLPFRVYRAADLFAKFDGETFWQLRAA